MNSRKALPIAVFVVACALTACASPPEGDAQVVAGRSVRSVLLQMTSDGGYHAELTSTAAGDGERRLSIDRPVRDRVRVTQSTPYLQLIAIGRALYRSVDARSDAFELDVLPQDESALAAADPSYVVLRALARSKRVVFESHGRFRFPANVIETSGGVGRAVLREGSLRSVSIETTTERKLIRFSYGEIRDVVAPSQDSVVELPSGECKAPQFEDSTVPCVIERGTPRP